MYEWNSENSLIPKIPVQTDLLQMLRAEKCLRLVCIAVGRQFVSICS
jgi:hypothetical protein